MRMDPKDPIQDPEKRVYLTEVEEDYPSKKVVIPALLAAYLVCFLFALVYLSRLRQCFR